MARCRKHCSGGPIVTNRDVTERRPLTTIIVGAGPGLGQSVARRFGQSGGAIGLVSRSPERLRHRAEELAAEGVDAEWEAADATDPEALRSALTELVSRLGPIDVLCFSPIPDIALIRPVLETSAENLIKSLSLSVGGAAAAVEAVVPGMIARGSGTVLFTTGSGALKPSPDRAASAVATTAEAAYASILSQALAPLNVRVRHLVIVGPIGRNLKHDPDAVAEHLWSITESGNDVVTVLDHP